ncbi:protein EPIDERMAL PATTERNING FACTOR 2-like [Abrus precatorius]|uniref:Epidermal patterning factor-like protein n=1 Tax=Abrus precatorius TaxID=3816 RepID=A0A8B8LMI4_ABRPR|nr:protein EPIDERMAL PATTERNING FACTOR 2-like [Abrus precatorius]
MSTFSLETYKFFLLVSFFMLLSNGWSLGVIPNHVKLMNLQEARPANEEKGAKKDMGMELYPTGSTLPDCSHACGSCFPCKRVIVSYKCLIAESCPVVYRCMCKGKYYHVPSNG